MRISDWSSDVCSSDLVAPGPDAAQLKDIVAPALRTPDHGKLAPWRIVTIGDDQRDAFAALLKQAWVAENPGAAGMDLSALDQFAHQAPSVSRQISRSEERRVGKECVSTYRFRG